MRQNPLLWSALFLSVLFFLRNEAEASDDPNAALRRAMTLSSLSGPGARPFHVKLTISEPANPNSPYHASIEENWQSAKRWSRIITSPGFKQILDIDGSRSMEQTEGEYYPLWLRDFVSGTIDPLENDQFWQQVSARIAINSSVNGQPSTSCARAQFKIGTAALNNDNFAIICFNADGTLQNLVSPGYSMEFHDPRPFAKKRIASRLVDHLEPGTTLVGAVETLEELSATTPVSLLDVSAANSTNAIRVVRINQGTFNELSSGQPDLVWPPVHSGNTIGKLSMYLSIDRNGRIREVYPLNSDNAGLQDSARDQLMKWQLKPAVSNGERVQTEAAITVAFSTKLDQSPQVDSGSSAVPTTAAPDKIIRISSGIAQSLLLKSYPPVHPSEAKARHLSGTVAMTAIISKNGTVSSLTPASSPDPLLTDAAMAAVKQWVYRPYLLNGSPVEVQTTINVHFDMR